VRLLVKYCKVVCEQRNAEATMDSSKRRKLTTLTKYFAASIWRLENNFSELALSREVAQHTRLVCEQRNAEATMDSSKRRKLTTLTKYFAASQGASSNVAQHTRLVCEQRNAEATMDSSKRRRLE